MRVPEKSRATDAGHFSCHRSDAIGRPRSALIRAHIWQDRLELIFSVVCLNYEKTDTVIWYLAGLVRNAAKMRIVKGIDWVRRMPITFIIWCSIDYQD
jgi:hypothetical protein